MNNELELFFESFLLNSGEDKLAIIYNDKEYTYKDILKNSFSIIDYLKKNNLIQGDRLLVSLDNSIEFVFLYFACMFGGFTIIPINKKLPQKDIDYIKDLTNPKMYIQSNFTIEEQSNNQDFKLEYNPGQVFSIFFTSGTTSKPKGVCHSVENMISNCKAFGELTNLDDRVRILHVLPMGYMAGFLNTILLPLLFGGSAVIAPQFNAGNSVLVWEYAIKYDINTVWLTPTMANLLARLNRNEDVPKWTGKNLKNIFVGTAPYPEATKKKFDQTFKVESLESYGMSELLFVSSNIKQNDCPQGSAGKILSGVDVKILQPEKIMSNGNEGEIWIKSKYSFIGYLSDNGKSMVNPMENGWLSSGDYGFLDKNNYLFITGRTKDLIIHGGTNVSPKAIENVLLKYPDIFDAAVIGKPHSFWGEEVFAFIILNEENDFDKNALLKYCKENLNEDAVPSSFKVLDSFPRSSTGKIKKNELRELF